MNRTLIVVKDYSKSNSPHRYRAIRLHWNEGETVEMWLKTYYPDHVSALNLIWAGHRSDINTPQRHSNDLPEHWNFRTIAGARAYCEHVTFAYHDGKRWRFDSDPTSLSQEFTPNIGV